MLGILGSLFGLAGQGISAFLGLKTQQSEVIKESIKLLGDINTSEAQREQAIAQIVAAEEASDSWLARTWRPLTMVVFLGIIVAFWFGVQPPHINDPMGPMMAEIFGIIKIGLGAYIPARSLEKIVSSVAVGTALKQFMGKSK